MQETIVSLIVLLAAGVVGRRYLPAGLRRRAAATVAQLLRRLGFTPAALWLEQTLPAASSCADGCGSCGNCTPVAGAASSQFSITPEALKQTIRRF